MSRPELYEQLDRRHHRVPVGADRADTTALTAITAMRPRINQPLSPRRGATTGSCRASSRVHNVECSVAWPENYPIRQPWADDCRRRGARQRGDERFPRARNPEDALELDPRARLQWRDGRRRDSSNSPYAIGPHRCGGLRGTPRCPRITISGEHFRRTVYCLWALTVIACAGASPQLAGHAKPLLRGGSHDAHVARLGRHG